MVMRSKPKGPSVSGGAPGTRAQPDLPEELPAIPDDDGFVMVMFPRETWAKVIEMAKSRDVEPAGVLSVALELLDERMKEAENGAGRG